MPQAKDVSDPRGCKTAYAYFMQVCRQEHQKKYPDKAVIFSDFSRIWKTMLEKEKVGFQEMAVMEGKRCDLEMEDYVPAEGEKGLGKKRKDPNAPKRSLSAFFWFCGDQKPFKLVNGMNAGYGVGEMAKEMERLWHEAEPEVKQKYEAMAERNNARYEREMTYKEAREASASAHQNDDEPLLVCRVMGG